MNQNTGRYLNNSQVDRSFFESLRYHVSPFPVYFFNRAYTMDLYGEHSYLSDGGNSENLAAFPLVRRLCENIILVDAEYDPNYAFEAYFKLKEALGRELSVSTKLDPQPAHLNLKGGVDDIDAAIEKQRTRQNVDKSDWIEPITKQYFSRRQPVKYGEEVVTYYDSVLKGTCELRPRVFAWFKDCAFPHYPTTYQNYSESQFAAYVKLGECAVLNHLDYDATRQSVAVRTTPKSQCSAS